LDEGEEEREERKERIEEITSGLRLDTNRLNTSHSQRLNSGKPLGTGRCGWWCSIDPCPNEPLPEITREELIEVVRKVKRAKVSGENGIENEAWKYMTKEIGDEF